MKYCHTPYAERLLLSSSQSDILAGFFILLSPLGIIANALVIWALIKTKAIYDKRCRMNWILLFISISDITIGVVTIPLIAVLFTKYKFIRFCELEKATLFIGQVNLHFSGYNLFFMGLEQYLHLDPMLGSRNRELARRLTTNRGLIFIVAMSIFLSVCHGVLSATSFQKRTIPDAINGILNIGLFVACFFFYVIMFLRMRKVSMETQAILKPGDRLHKPTVPRYVHKFAKFVSLLLLGSSLCYTPFLVIELVFAGIKYVQHKRIGQTLRFINFLLWLPMLSYSIVNAVIILSVKSNLRKFVLEKLHLKSLSLRSDSVENVITSSSQMSDNCHSVHSSPHGVTTTAYSMSEVSSPASTDKTSSEN